MAKQKKMERFGYPEDEEYDKALRARLIRFSDNGYGMTIYDTLGNIVFRDGKSTVKPVGKDKSDETDSDSGGVRRPQ